MDNRSNLKFEYDLPYKSTDVEANVKTSLTIWIVEIMYQYYIKE